ncbi:MAG: ABC transporter substrate-binding protein [Alkalilacustris sp.]
MRKTPVTAAAAAMALLAWAGAAHAEDRPDLTVAVQMILTSGTLEPLNEQSNVGARTFHSIFDNLIDRDWDNGGAMIPGLATAWERIDDRTVELTLRQGVIFHNGDEMTAEDVAFTFGEARMLGEDAPQRATVRRLWPTLERVEVVDAYTVRFITSEPEINLENRIARYGSQIISRRAFEEAGSWEAWSRAPVGTGPFRIARFEPDDFILLEAHDAYWQGPPPFASIRWQEVPETSTRVSGLLAGDFDIVTDIPPDQLQRIEAAPGVRVEGGPILNHRILTYDENHPVLADPRVRAAIGLAIDRELIVETLWQGMTRVPQGLQFEQYDDLFIGDFEMAYDLDRARALLAEAGYDGTRIEYRILDDYYTNELATGQILIEMWRAVGLNVDLGVRENWGQIVDNDGTRAIRNWSNSAPFPDPVSSLVSQHGPAGGQQTGGYWTNEEFNAHALTLETSTDQEARRAAFARMLEIWHDEDPGGTVLHQNAIFYGVRDGIEWSYYPNQYMDFRARAVRLRESN